MRGQRGAALVEMAFTVVLLLWLALGIVDVGRAIFTQIALQDAAQAGASFASFTSDATRASVKEAAVTSTNSLALTSDDVAIACTEVERESDASRVRVTARYSLEYITPLVGPALGGHILLEKPVEAERYFDSCNDLKEEPW